MAETKTKPTEVAVDAFINAVESPKKREDAFALKQMMEEVTGEKAKMWGPSIIGFGKYHYKYATGHEGDAPIVGFSPRKAAITLYVTVPGHEDEKLLNALGKFKKSKSCIYFNKLSDLNLDVLEQIVKSSVSIHGR